MRYRSVSIGLFFQMIVGFVLFGLNYIIPTFAQLMLGYTALQAGAPANSQRHRHRIDVSYLGAIVGKVDARILVVLGLSLLSVSCWLLSR